MPKKDRTLTEKDLKSLEKKFEKLRDKEMEFYMEYLKIPWKLFSRSFLVGTAKGLGFFLGSAIIITIISYILSHVLSNIPEAGDFFQNLSSWLEHTAQER